MAFRNRSSLILKTEFQSFQSIKPFSNQLVRNNNFRPWLQEAGQRAQQAENVDLQHAGGGQKLMSRKLFSSVGSTC